MVVKMRKEIKSMLFFLFFSFIILMFTSKFSFLYAFNDWQDANSFLTVARSMLEGKILYKDLIEQKGPILYMIYCLGYLLNFKQIEGIFILEIINLSIVMYFANLIFNMYKKSSVNKYMSVIFGLIICTAVSFAHGGSAEEFCLSLLIIGLYYFNKNFIIRPLINRESFLIGFITALIFLIKLNLIFLPIFSIICMCIDELLNKNYKRILNIVLYFFLGVSFICLIFSVYFIINNNFSNFVYCYFTINGRFYINNNLGIVQRIYQSYQLSIRNLSLNVISIPLFILYFLFVYKSKTKVKIRLYTVLVYIFMFIGIYIGLKYYKYYALPLFIIFIYSFIYLNQFIYKYLPLKREKYSKVLIYKIIFLLIIPICAYCFANYRDYMFLSEENFAQYRISNEILKYDRNPVILNYGGLDYGFYNILNVVPNCKYFHRMNIPYEKMKENYSVQKEYIDKGNVDFVIVGIKDDMDDENNQHLFKDLDWINQKYDLIYEDKQQYESDFVNFYLFRLNE